MKRLTGNFGNLLNYVVEVSNGKVMSILVNKHRGAEVTPAERAHTVSLCQASCRKCEVRIPKDEVGQSPTSTGKVSLCMAGSFLQAERWDVGVAAEQVRVGLVMDSGRFGITTRWQHLRCTIFTGIDTVDAIDGFEYLQGELGLAIKAGRSQAHTVSRRVLRVVGPDEHKGLVRDRLDRSATEVDEDLQPIEPDELVRKEWTQVMEPPPTLILPILPYQKEGLGWMYNQVGPPSAIGWAERR